MTDAPVTPRKINLLALIGFIGVFFASPIGIVLGVIAQRQIQVTHEDGRGLARAAVSLGVVFTALQLLFFVVWLSLFLPAFTGGFGNAVG